MDLTDKIRYQNRRRTRKRRAMQRTLLPFRNISGDSDSDDNFRVGEPSARVPEDPLRYNEHHEDAQVSMSEADSVMEENNVLEDVEGLAMYDIGGIDRSTTPSSEDNVAEVNSSAYEETSDSSGEEMCENDNHVDINPEILELREWAINCKIYQTHLDKLLIILRSRLLPSLPKSSKTFLSTNDASYEIENMEDAEGRSGQFVYFGIENGLRECVNVELHENNVIELQFHVDEMPLTKSGNDQVWAALGKVHSDPDLYKPFEIAVFHGQTKPKNSEIFLDKFVEELNTLQRTGVEISARHFNVRLKCVIADTPARSFLKNTLGHGGIFACERCTVQGHKVEHTTVYPSSHEEERTDVSFRSFQQPEHHHGVTPFLRIIPFINMIAFFVLDFMHLCCQGTMKKLIEYWMSGDLNFKFSSRNKIELTNRLKHIKSQMPCKFQRKTRSIKSIAKWKATELRFFLLYCGPIVLKGILRDEFYNHFLLFHASCRILCSKIICLRYVNQARQYLRSFFTVMKDYYGEKSQVLNAHHLIHLTDDVEFMQCSLSFITAFPFENALGKIKNYIRTPYRPLAQLCRRLFENRLLRNRKPEIPPVVKIIKYSRGHIKQIKYKEWTICTTFPNNMMIMDDDSIMKIQEIIGNVEAPGLLQVKGVLWEKDKAIYQYPCDSTRLQMWELKNKPSKNVRTRSVTAISNKLIRLSVIKENGLEKFYGVGMLH